MRWVEVMLICMATIWDSMNKRSQCNSKVMASMLKRIGICLQLLLMIGVMRITLQCNNHNNKWMSMDKTNSNSNHSKDIRIQMMEEWECRIGKSKAHKSNQI